MNTVKQNYHFPEYTVGVCYYPEHWEESLWERDLERMLAAGIRVVRVAEFAWTITEPEEGTFCFDFFDRFLDLCQTKGMKVIFGTPTATPPAWLTTKYPEVLNCNMDRVYYQHGSRRHYNYNAPIYREKTKIIVTALAEHYGKHPAICGWQIDNELNCETADFYSQADTVAFRRFLRDTYGSLDALNKAWGAVFWNQTYTDWEQINLPGPALNQGWNPHQRLDYLRFVSHSVRSFCKLQADILRQYVKPDDFITTNGWFEHMDNHRMCQESLDVYTYDSYPNFAFGLNRKNIIRNGQGGLHDRRSSHLLSEVRSICPHFGVMEQQSAAGGWASRMESPMPRPGQVKLWAMQSVAHGADFVSFFRWRTCTFGTEIYWHGILDYDNRDNRRLAEVTDFAQTLKKLEPLCGSEFRAQMAVVKDYDNVWDSEVDAWLARITAASNEAIIEQAQRSHIPYDVLYLSDTSSVEELLKYPVLIYPHPSIMTKERANVLCAYVEQGGTLILGCRSGFKQENGKCIMLPQPGLLSDLTGTVVREFSFEHPAEPDVVVNWDGDMIPAPVFNDQLEAKPGAKVLAEYGSSWFAGAPALVENTLGAGRCLHWGSSFSREALDKLFDYIGIREPFKEIAQIPNTVEIVERRKDGCRYLMLLNYQSEKQEIVLHREAYDMIGENTVSGTVTMDAYGVLVLKLSD